MEFKAIKKAKDETTLWCDAKSKAQTAPDPQAFQSRTLLWVGNFQKSSSQQEQHHTDAYLNLAHDHIP